MALCLNQKGGRLSFTGVLAQAGSEILCVEEELAVGKDWQCQLTRKQWHTKSLCTVWEYSAGCVLDTHSDACTISVLLGTYT